MRSALVAGVAAVMLTTSSGCSILSNAAKQFRNSEKLDEFMLSHRNKVFAARAWIREKDQFANQPHLGHFKAGYFAGYINVASGGEGCCPTMAPKEYWGWKYQNPGGQGAINAWFAGFPLGVKAAEKEAIKYWGRAPVIFKSTKPADQLPPQAPKNQDVMLGPDGKPVPPEIIVPGSERIIESIEPMSPLDIENLAPPVPSETIPAPVPGGVGEGSPTLLDDAYFDVSPRNGSDAVMPATVGTPGTSSGNAFGNGVGLRPANAGTSFSLNDQPAAVVANDADAINGIFRSGQVVSGNSAGTSFSAPETSASTKTTSAEIATEASGIPFKFE